MELAVYSLIVLGLIVVANYLGTRWFKRLDLTEGKEFTISQATKKTMKDSPRWDIVQYWQKNKEVI